MSARCYLPQVIDMEVQTGAQQRDQQVSQVQVTHLHHPPAAASQQLQVQQVTHLHHPPAAASQQLQVQQVTHLQLHHPPGSSAVSERAPELYGNLRNVLDTTASEEKQAVCLLTLTTPVENNKFFDWISVPNEGKTPTVYIINGDGGFGKYFDQSGGIVKDPMKIYSNLLFMRSRLDRLRSVCDKAKQIKLSDVDTRFRNDILGLCCSRWLNKLPLDQLIIDYAVTVSILDMELNGLIYNGMNSESAKYELETHKNEPGAFLLRNSSRSNVKGDSTVFTITYIRDDRTCFNIRFVDLHGIGIYATTAVSGDIRCFPIADNIVRSAERKQILAAVNYQPPNYACIIDLLIDFDKRGYIKIHKLLVQSSSSVKLDALMQPFAEETKLLLKEKEKKEALCKLKQTRQTVKNLHRLIKMLTTVTDRHIDSFNKINRLMSCQLIACAGMYEPSDLELSELDDDSSTSHDPQKIKIDNAITDLTEIDLDIGAITTDIKTLFAYDSLLDSSSAS